MNTNKSIDPRSSQNPKDKKLILSHIVIKLLKTSNKQKILKAARGGKAHYFQRKKNQKLDSILLSEKKKKKKKRVIKKSGATSFKYRKKTLST